jgi:hypothetical protein
VLVYSSSALARPHSLHFIVLLPRFSTALAFALASSSSVQAMHRPDPARCVHWRVEKEARSLDRRHEAHCRVDRTASAIRRSISVHGTHFASRPFRHCDIVKADCALGC